MMVLAVVSTVVYVTHSKFQKNLNETNEQAALGSPVCFCDVLNDKTQKNRAEERGFKMLKAIRGLGRFHDPGDFINKVAKMEGFREDLRIFRGCAASIERDRGKACNKHNF